MSVEDFAIRTIRNNFTLTAKFSVLITSETSESPFVGNNNLLTTGELEFGTTESLNDSGFVGVFAADRDKRLANVYTSNHVSGFTVGVTHTSLETIGSGTGKHFVHTNNVVRVDTNTEVEGVLSGDFGNVLVAGNTSGLKRL